jgi:hypothetical protein
MEHQSKPSPAQRAFLHYLRTGQRLPEEHFLDETEVELKFNPYHDPRNGQFTFAPGGPRALSHVIVSRGRTPASRSSNAKAPTTKRPVSAPSSRMSGIALSRTHKEFLAMADKFPPRPGTADTWEDRGQAGISKARFKDQFIAGHSNAIRAAAEKYDVPAPLVASIAYRELGNDDAMNDTGYALRAESGRKIPEALGIIERGRNFVRDLNRPRDETSFGPYNIQQRRAAEILGYGNINVMSETARRTLVSTTRNPVAATFMVAKHLSDLRNQDFPGVPGRALTGNQMIVIATRYNKGPEISRD